MLPTKKDNILKEGWGLKVNDCKQKEIQAQVSEDMKKIAAVM